MNMTLSLIFVLGFADTTPIIDFTPDQVFWKFPPQEMLPGSDTSLETYLNDYGQVTLDGRILLANRQRILDYGLNGEFRQAVNVEPPKRILCQTYDADLDQYVVSTMLEANGEKAFFLDFYDADGRLANTSPVAFKYQGVTRSIVQLRYLGQNRFLVNFWSEKMGHQTQNVHPATLVIAERVGTLTEPVLEPLGDAFDAQWGSRQVLKNNFKDRWAVFSEDGSTCMVAHTIARDLQVYTAKTIDGKRADDSFDYTFTKRNPKLDLDFWQSEVPYPSEMREQAKQQKLGLSGFENVQRWNYFPSRIRGMYPLEKGLVVLGYTSPNPRHRFYRDNQLWPEEHLELKNSTSPYLLTLRTMVLEGNATNKPPELTPDEIVIPGGILLGTYQDSAFVLVETQVAEKSFEYELHRIDYSSY